MTKLYLPLSILFFILSGIKAQEPLKHEKKVYISPDQKVYVNKLMPIYLSISTSSEPNSQTYKLPSPTTAAYANPMYFDTEGKNTFQHPWEVDPKTNKPVMPLRDVVYEVYADGKAPVTIIKLNNTTKFVKNGEIFFGKGLKLNINAVDTTSGVEATYLSINQATYQQITQAEKDIDEEKQYTIAYYSVDHVGNAEQPRFEKFRTDFAPPATTYEIIGEKKGNVLSSKATIKLVSSDSLSGVNRIMCSINDGPERPYNAPIPFSVLKDGKSKIQYYAVDNVGNKETAKVISASNKSGSSDNSGSSAYDYYIDNEPPVISIEVVGDQFNGKYLFISGNSKMKINATDEKSGVAKVMYSVNNTSLKDSYSEPFDVATQGVNNILYASSDNVGNLALAKFQQVCVDKTAPASKIYFSGLQYKNHDTLFITKDTKIGFNSYDALAGFKQLDYSLDAANAVYSAPFGVDKEGYHSIGFYSIDNVSNKEASNKAFFYVDNTAPEIYYHFSVKPIGEKTVRGEKYEIYPSNIMLYIAVTDNASGGERVEYRINGKKDIYTAIPVKGFYPGNFDIEITAYDVLKNKTTKTIHFAIEN
jgi:hypothetical protein